MKSKQTVALFCFISLTVAWIPCELDEECQGLSSPCKVYTCQYRCYSADGSCTGKRDLEAIDSANGTIEKRYICGCCQFSYNLPNGDTSVDDGLYCNGGWKFPFTN